MSLNNNPARAQFFRNVLYVALLVLTSGHVAAFDRSEAGCVAATAIPLDSTIRDVGDATWPRCYEVDVTTPGVLALEVNAMEDVSIVPRLDHSRMFCEASQAQSTAFDVLEQLPGYQLLAIHSPGAYQFCIDSQAHDKVTNAYKLSNIFVSILDVKGGDPREEEPDPDPLLLCPSAAVSSLPPLNLDVACRTLTEDDYGDISLCSAPLSLHHETEGKIWNSWGDDEDFFVVVLEELVTVRIEAVAENAVFGGLYDRFGHRLYAEVRENSRGWYIFKTLAPGRYALKVMGKNGLNGSYRLRVELVR